MRLADKYQNLKVITPDGRELNRTLYRHYNPYCDVSENYGKMEAPFIHMGIAKKGLIGNATSVLCDAVDMVDLTTSFLHRNPKLFGDDLPIPTEWYII